MSYPDQVLALHSQGLAAPATHRPEGALSMAQPAAEQLARPIELGARSTWPRLEPVGLGTGGVCALEQMLRRLEDRR